MNLPVFDPKENQQRLREYKNSKDPAFRGAIKESLVTSNIRIVVSRVEEALKKSVKLLSYRKDLLQIGLMALERAIDGYNPDNKTKAQFHTYADKAVRNSILRAMPRMLYGYEVHVERYVQKFWNAFEALSQEKGRYPSFEEVFQKMAVSQEKAQLIRSALARRKTVSLDGPIPGHSRSNLTFNDTIKDTYDFVDEVEGKCIKEALKEELAELLKTLSAEERKVIGMWVGFEGEGMSMEEIGEILPSFKDTKRTKISRQRVSQIVQKALKKLRQNPQAKKLKPYLAALGT